MKRLIQWVMAATLICGATVFTACSSSNDNPVIPDLNVAEKIIGKWVQVEIDGQPALTDKEMVIKIISPTKAYISGSRASKSSSGLWADHMEADVVISGNNVTVTFCHAEQSTSVHKFNITAINSSEFTAHQKVTVTEKGTVVRALDYTVRFEKVTADYSADILGTWEGQVTSEQDTYGDGQKHRWEFKADGTYVYYVKNGENWVPSDNTLNEYFVDGSLLCMRWINTETEYREWWDIESVENGEMKWKALRQNADGTTFNSTFEMKKVE